MPPLTPLSAATPAPVSLGAPVPLAETDERRALLMQKSQEMEAAFLSEMLSFAGLGASEGSFSGGIGEEQFASFLRAEQAKLMVSKGGIGLAEQIFQSLVRPQP